MLCEHGYTANWGCPYCLRECGECKRLVPEQEIGGQGICYGCEQEQIEATKKENSK